MQEKKDTFDIFLRRTDFLANRLTCEIERLPEILGISRASLFGYRSGARPITNKAWRKLESAEKAAGINQPTISDWNQPLPPEVQAKFKEATAPITNAQEQIAEAMRPLQEQINRLTDMVEQLLSQKATSSSSPSQTAVNESKNKRA